MRAVCLMDDTTKRPGMSSEHGFSLYVKTKKHELLVDLGRSGRTLENAVRLGIDPCGVDTAILSHGHYDHSGGLMELLGMNEKVRVYMRRNAVCDFYSEKNGLHYIGIDKRIADSDRVVYTDEMLRIDDEISLFSGVYGRRAWPEGNRLLKVRDEQGGYLCDDFSHEQYTVVSSDGITVLVSGCSHNGILNILDRFRALFGCHPDVFIGGFHMVKDAPFRPSELDMIRETAKVLLSTKTVYYAGHCTGENAFSEMRAIMGDRLRPIGAGETIIR